MIDPAVVDRIVVLAQVALVFSVTALVVRLGDLAVREIRERKLARKLERRDRLAARRRAWREIDELHDPRRVW